MYKKNTKKKNAWYSEMYQYSRVGYINLCCSMCMEHGWCLRCSVNTLSKMPFKPYLPSCVMHAFSNGCVFIFICAIFGENCSTQPHVTCTKVFHLYFSSMCVLRLFADHVDYFFFVRLFFAVLLITSIWMLHTLMHTVCQRKIAESKTTITTLWWCAVILVPFVK